MLNLNLIDNVLKSPLARALSWPHSPESYLDFLAPKIGGRTVKATIKAIRQQSPRAVSLVLQPNHRWAGHVPGQYVTLTATLNGRRLSRCFTISHIEDGCPVVTIQARSTDDAQGHVSVSRWANETAWVGDTVELSSAMGDFVLPQKRPDALLMIAGGSGITPIRAMLDQLLAERYRGRVDILYYVPTVLEAIFLGHLKSVCSRLADAHLHVVTTRETVDAGDLQGHFSPKHLKAIKADITVAQAYVCGPAGLIDAVAAHHAAQGQSARLIQERFQAAVVVPVSTGDAQPVTFADSQVTTSAAGRTLLEIAEGAGLNPTAGCRQGICRTCTCRKTSGQVRDLRTGELSGEGEEDIAICVSVPVSPVTVEL